MHLSHNDIQFSHSGQRFIVVCSFKKKAHFLDGFSCDFLDWDQGKVTSNFVLSDLSFETSASCQVCYFNDQFANNSSINNSNSDGSQR